MRNTIYSRIIIEPCDIKEQRCARGGLRSGWNRQAYGSQAASACGSSTAPLGGQNLSIHKLTFCTIKSILFIQIQRLAKGEIQMGREIVTNEDVHRRATSGGLATAIPQPGSGVDDYSNRLLKYIPAEVIAVFLTIEGILLTAESLQLGLFWVVFFCSSHIDTSIPLACAEC